MGSTVIFDPASRAALGRRVTQKALREFAATLEKQVTRGRAFNCLLTGDGEIKRLNRQFRSQNYSTDVLSFPAVDGPGTGTMAGELAISADRALSQSVEYGHSLEEELRILMLHGVLHLTGLDHESDDGAMARAELRWRKAFGLPNGLIERAQ